MNLNQLEFPLSSPFFSRPLLFIRYSVVHPTEDNIHLRIQSNSKDTTSVDILRTGLQNLRSASQHIAMEYEDALIALKAKSESETQK